jgi:phosphoglycerol transferase MdoB-like AlkP superfamily enzyme
MTKDGLKALDNDDATENDQPNQSQPQPSLKLQQKTNDSLNNSNKKDSGHYHYKPETPQKSKVTATSNDSSDMLQPNVTDLLRTRFAI